MSEIGRAAKWLKSHDPKYKTTHSARQALMEYVRSQSPRFARGRLGQTDRYLVRVWPGRSVYISSKQLAEFECELMQAALEGV